MVDGELEYNKYFNGTHSIYYMDAQLYII